MSPGQTNDTFARVARARTFAAMFQRAVPERIVIVGDEVQTTWAPWMDAQLRDCQRVQAAWLEVAHAVAGFDDDNLLTSLGNFEATISAMVPPVLP